jgi:hypothetical protein
VTATGFPIQVDSAGWAKSQAVFSTQWSRWKRQRKLILGYTANIDMTINNCTSVFVRLLAEVLGSGCVELFGPGCKASVANELDGG